MDERTCVSRARASTGNFRYIRWRVVGQRLGFATMETDPNTTFHLARNGAPLPQRNQAEVSRALEVGELLPTDLGWCEGMDDWKALGEMFPVSHVAVEERSETAPTFTLPASADGPQTVSPVEYATCAPLASLGSRLWGAIVDSILMVIVIIAAGVLGEGAAFFEGIADQPTDHSTKTWVSFGIGFMLFQALQGYLITKNGQSIGKIVAKTRIYSEKTGEQAGFMDGFLIRNLVTFLPSYIPFVGDFLSLVDTCFIFRPDRRCIHDLVAGTVVLEAG